MLPLLIACDGRPARPRRQAEAAIALASAQEFPQWLAVGMHARGWALAMQGQGEEGMAQMRQALAAWRAMGAGAIVSYFLALLAEACGKAEQAEEGLRLLAEALAHGHHRGALLCSGGVPAQGSCCCARPSLTRPRLRPVCTRPWTSPATSRPGRGSCERQ